MYGLKAAEKLNNLSNELEKLSIYLEEELNFTDYASSEEELNAKEERIESAIHMIRTLKSVNDTSLSDWQGVIGEELDEQKQERIEKEERLSALVGQVEDLLQHQRQDLIGSHESTQGMHQELKALKHDLRNVLAELGSPTLLTKVERRVKREDVSSHCPACGSVIAYRQRAKPTSVKTLQCAKCEAKLVARYSLTTGHYVEIRGPKEEKIACPNCGVAEAVWIDNVPGAGINARCTSCGVVYRATRNLQGVTATAIKVTASAQHDGDNSMEGRATTAVEGESVDEKLIEMIRKILPPQPWPTGVHKRVGEQLRLEPKIVSRVLQELMRKGVYKLQIDGKLYEEISAPTKSSIDAKSPATQEDTK